MEIYRIKKRISPLLGLGIIIFDIFIMAILAVLLFNKDLAAEILSFTVSSSGYWLTLVFFIFAAIFFGFGSYVLFTTKDPLLIRDDGFIDQSSYLALGFIPWNEVIRIYPTYVLTEKFLSVELKNQQSYIDKQTSLKRILMKINKASGYSAIQIPFTAIMESPEEICEMMLVCWQNSKEEKQ